MKLVEDAVDAGIRVVCINDHVATEDELWQERLAEALNHHARSNRYTSQRIKRKHDALWEMGAAIGLLRSGYTRRATIPARMGVCGLGQLRVGSPRCKPRRLSRHTIGLRHLAGLRGLMVQWHAHGTCGDAAIDENRLAGEVPARL
jgi:hypothetical protein